jgi:hypothetical protein
MFHEEGGMMGKVLEVCFADPKFATGPDDFDICLHIQKTGDPSQADWWRGEMSQNYGKGNFATQTQAQITMQALHKVGFEGEDLTKLEAELVGKEIPFFVKKTEKEDGKTFFNIKYIGAGGGDIPKPIEGNVNDRLARLMGKNVVAGMTTPAKPSATQSANPFKKGTTPKSPFG